MSFTRFQLLLQRIDANKFFQTLVMAVIILSALSIGAHTYKIPVWFEHLLSILDYAVTIFFAMEITIRFFACGNTKTFFSKGWNIFDTIIVIGSLIPVAGSTVLLARLLRIFRALRLISFIPELRLLINALLIAIPRMGYIALLMFVIFYIYATIGSILFSTINPDYWGDVGLSMLTMFRIATFESWTSVMYETMRVHPLSWTFYVSFIFLATFIFLNMMVGTILDVMSNETNKMKREQETDDEQLATIASVNELKQQLAELKSLLEKRS